LRAHEERPEEARRRAGRLAQVVVGRGAGARPMLNDLLYRLRALLRRSEAEHDLHDELQFHLERNVEKLTATGLSREEALRRARMALGGVAQAKEATRQSCG